MPEQVEDTVEDTARLEAGHDRRACREPESVESEVAGASTWACVGLQHGDAQTVARGKGTRDESTEPGPDHHDVTLLHWNRILTRLRPCV